MKAPEVLARVESATPAELAAMRLYEGLHRRREKVLGAIDKRLESTSTSD